MPWHDLPHLNFRGLTYLFDILRCHHFIGMHSLFTGESNPITAHTALMVVVVVGIVRIYLCFSCSTIKCHTRSFVYVCVYVHAFTYVRVMIVCIVIKEHEPWILYIQGTCHYCPFCMSGIIKLLPKKWLPSGFFFYKQFICEMWTDD